MKKRARLFHFVLALSFTLIFAFSICEFLSSLKPVNNLFNTNKTDRITEEYDPQLKRINSVSKLQDYTDSQLLKSNFKELASAATYPLALNEVIRKRFYHGLYTYSVGNNFIAYLATKVSGRSWNEVWSAEDILKSPHAFCGQQSLVMMDLLMKKGYSVRSVKMYSSSYKAGHFALEVFYDNKWHFFDPDMEPNESLLNSMGRPSFEEIGKNSALMATMYPHAEKAMVSELFANYTIGNKNELMPRHMYVFQAVTKYLSYVSWFICLIFYFLFLHKYNFSVSGIWPRFGFRHQSATDELIPVS